MFVESIKTKAREERLRLMLFTSLIKTQSSSNDLLDAMLVGVKTQDDLWGKEGIITQISKALLERILNAEMDFPFYRIWKSC